MEMLNSSAVIQFSATTTLPVSTKVKASTTGVSLLPPSNGMILKSPYTVSPSASTVTAALHPLPTPSATDNNKQGGIDGGGIAGVTIAILMLLASIAIAVILVIIFLLKKTKQRSKQ